MIAAVERYLSAVDLRHPIWHRLRLAPLLWHYLYGKSSKFPTNVSLQHPLCSQTPRLLRNRSLARLIADMKKEGSMPKEEVTPSPSTIDNYLRKRSLYQWTLSTAAVPFSLDTPSTNNTTQGSSAPLTQIEVIPTLNNTPIRCLSDRALRRTVELTSPEWHDMEEYSEEETDAGAAAAAAAATVAADESFHPVMLSPVIDSSADDFIVHPTSPASIDFSIWDTAPIYHSSQLDSKMNTIPVQSVYSPDFMDHDKRVHSS